MKPKQIAIAALVVVPIAVSLVHLVGNMSTMTEHEHKFWIRTLWGCVAVGIGLAVAERRRAK